MESCNPGGPNSACFEHINTLYNTSTSCLYLNRGSPLPIVLADSAGFLYVTWDDSGYTTGCVSGAIVQFVFEFDGAACGASPIGCFSLTYLKVYDSYGRWDDSANTKGVRIAGPHATVNGGDSFCAATAARPMTWGRIKAQYLAR